MSGESPEDYKQVALDFTKALAARDYVDAYALTSRNYRESTSVTAMQAAFEGIVPIDWGTADPIEIGQTMEVWPGREPSDAGWAYVSIGGDVYSEAVTLVVTREEVCCGFVLWSSGDPDAGFRFPGTSDSSCLAR